MANNPRSQFAAGAVREITGRPASIIGNWIVPQQFGKTKLRISGDVIECEVKVFFGLEKRITYLRIQEISAVSIFNGRIWWLLWIGICTLYPYWFIGLILIVAFFLVKNNALSINEKGQAIAMTYSNNTEAQTFCENVLKLSKQLNTTIVQQPARNPRANPNRQKQDRQRGTGGSAHRKGAFS